MMRKKLLLLPLLSCFAYISFTQTFQIEKGSLRVGTTNAYVDIRNTDLQTGTSNGFLPYFINHVGGDLYLGRIGQGLRFSHSSNSWGLGTTIPHAKFHIRDANGGYDASPTTPGLILLGDVDGYNLTIDANEFMARNNGNTAPIFINHEGGDVHFFENGPGNLFAKGLPFGDHSNLQYESSTGRFFYDTSSRRHKENINDLEDDWKKVLDLRPVTYTRPAVPDHWEFGYVAEEVDSIGLKSMVGYDSEGIPNDVRYDKMILYLVEIIKIHEQEINELRKRQVRERGGLKSEKALPLSSQE
jgi:hypothetical protein